jgi:hypothetical protein
MTERTDDSRSERRYDSRSERRNDSRIDRRALLRIGAAGLAAAVAGCTDGGDEPPDDADAGRADGGDPDPTESIPYADEYETVVDVVADAGADPDAGQSILPILDREGGDDTLLYFPPGEYLMDEIWEVPAFEHLGLVGENATIVPRLGDFGYLFVLGFSHRSASDLRFEGIDFDFTADDTAPRPLQAQVDDGLTVADVSVSGVGGTARFDVTTPDGEGVVRNLSMPDGGREPNPVGVLVGPANQGLIRFEDCEVSGFPGNGLYASPSNGPIEVHGGRFENNGIASVRVSSPATVRNVTVRCDEAPSGFRNMRGIRLRHGESITVENCRIVMRDLTYTDGGLVIEPMMESATIRDVEIECFVDDAPAVHMKMPRHDNAAAELDLENVTISGDAANGSAVLITDRANCHLDGFDVEQSGADRDGIHLVRTTESVLRDSEIDVTGDPLILEQSQLQRRNNRF